MGLCRRWVYANACAKGRERRNKRIAHFDMQTMLKAKAALRGPSREEIEVALEALRSVMNCIARHFIGTQTAALQRPPILHDSAHPHATAKRCSCHRLGQSQPRRRRALAPAGRVRLAD